MKKEFDEGIEYEFKRREVFNRLALGWVCIILAPIFSLFSVWDFNMRLLVGIMLTLVGGLSLWVGYNLRKEMKIIEAKWKK